LDDKTKSPVHNWWEIQGQMLDMWKESMDKMKSAKASGSTDDATKKMMENWMESQKNMMEFWQKSMTQFQPWKMGNMFSSQETDALRNWWEMQQKMLTYWQDAMNSFQTGGFFYPADFKGWTMPSVDIYQEMMKRTTSAYREFMKMIPTQVGQETFEKMSQTSDMYKSLLLFWESYFSNLPGKEDLDKWKEISSASLQSYNKILDEFFSLNLPEPFRSFMKTPAELSGLYQEVFINFFQPWIDTSGQLQAKYMEAAKGDREAYLDFLRLWQEAYSNSFGKILQMPALGKYGTSKCQP